MADSNNLVNRSGGNLAGAFHDMGIEVEPVRGKPNLIQFVFPNVTNIDDMTAMSKRFADRVPEELRSKITAGTAGGSLKIVMDLDTYDKLVGVPGAGVKQIGSQTAALSQPSSPAETRYRALMDSRQYEDRKTTGIGTLFSKIDQLGLPPAEANSLKSRALDAFVNLSAAEKHISPPPEHTASPVVKHIKDMIATVGEHAQQLKSSPASERSHVVERMLKGFDEERQGGALLKHLNAAPKHNTAAQELHNHMKSPPKAPNYGAAAGNSHLKGGLPAFAGAAGAIGVAVHNAPEGQELPAALGIVNETVLPGSTTIGANYCRATGVVWGFLAGGVAAAGGSVVTGVVTSAASPAVSIPASAAAAGYAFHKTQAFVVEGIEKRCNDLLPDAVKDIADAATGKVTKFLFGDNTLPQNPHLAQNPHKETIVKTKGTQIQ